MDKPTNTQIEEMVNYFVDGWDVDTLIAYAKDMLIEFYQNPIYEEDLMCDWEEYRNQLEDE